MNELIKISMIEIVFIYNNNDTDINTPKSYRGGDTQQGAWVHLRIGVHN
jgi:hypothetical protein